MQSRRNSIRILLAMAFVCFLLIASAVRLPELQPTIQTIVAIITGAAILYPIFTLYGDLKRLFERPDVLVKIVQFDIRRTDAEAIPLEELRQSGQQLQYRFRFDIDPYESNENRPAFTVVVRNIGNASLQAPSMRFTLLSDSRMPDARYASDEPWDFLAVYVGPSRVKTRIVDEADSYVVLEPTGQLMAHDTFRIFWTYSYPDTDRVPFSDNFEQHIRLDIRGANDPKVWRFDFAIDFHFDYDPR